MSGDLVSLHMVLVTAAAPDQDLWRRAASMASVPIDFVAQPPAAAKTALTKGADICVLDGTLSPQEQVALINAARASQTTPLLFMSGPQGAARLDGVDGVLGMPTDIDDARKLVEICIRAKYPTRVLVVDDSNTMRNIVRKILGASRFSLEIHEASEGIAALAQLRSGKFSIVFLDYNMPGLNGLETMMEIKRENSHVAVVLMTSTVDNALADRAHKAGALAFLKKPFYPADIDSVLERYYGLNAPI